MLPATGASLAGGRIRTSDGVWRDLLRSDAVVRAGPAGEVLLPMVPWSNRISGGLLTFGGRTGSCSATAPSGTAIHGAVAYSAWSVTEH